MARNLLWEQQWSKRMQFHKQWQLLVYFASFKYMERGKSSKYCCKNWTIISDYKNLWVLFHFTYQMLFHFQHKRTCLRVVNLWILTFLLLIFGPHCHSTLLLLQRQDLLSCRLGLWKQPTCWQIFAWKASESLNGILEAW